MNYVRKLGFEETPDYDFLRELFTKVLKTLNEPEDGIFDWMLLNGGKGWEHGPINVGNLNCFERRVLIYFVVIFK
jgi:casein kinase 1